MERNHFALISLLEFFFAKMKHTIRNGCWQALEQTNLVHVERWLCSVSQTFVFNENDEICWLRFLRQSKGICRLYYIPVNFPSFWVQFRIGSVAAAAAVVADALREKERMCLCVESRCHAAIPFENCQKKVCSNGLQNFTYSFTELRARR